MNNMEYNKLTEEKILNNTNCSRKNINKWNCRNKDNCSPNNKSLTDILIYNATDKK